MYEIADICKECQKRHLKNKKKWGIKCKGISKRLYEEDYYPTEETLDHEIYTQLTDDEKVELQLKNNILLWAKEKLGWSPYNPKREFYQFYQKDMLLCNALRQVGRLGRRLGKSEAIVIKALHFIDTSDLNNAQVTIVTPWENTIDEIFTRMRDMLDRQGSVFKDNYESTKKPYKIEFPNGNKIKGFTAGTKSGGGAGSVRGQKADFLILDEGAYLSQLDLQTLLALLQESKDTQLLVTSTPSGVPTQYKEWCLNDPEFKDFHVKSDVLPGFIEEEEEKLKKFYSEEAYLQEYMAEFFETSSKVFKDVDINKALKEYNYVQSLEELPDPENWICCAGVDYNEFRHGGQIVIYGFNKTTKKRRILNRVSIHTNSSDNNKFSKHVQTETVMRIKELDEAFNVQFWGVDKGHGSMQGEILTQYFFNKGQVDKLKIVDFGSNYVQQNPYTGETITKRMKVMLFSSLQKKLEYGELEISSIEEGDLTWEEKDAKHLVPQMKYYIIDHYDNRDQPVFAHRGDHILDALALANFMFVEYVEKFFSSPGNFKMTTSKVPNLTEMTIYQQPSNFKIMPIMSNQRQSFTNIYAEKESNEQFENVPIGNMKRKIKVSSIRSHVGSIKRSKFT